MYGRGDGFTDQEWEDFDAAQQSAADDLFTASAGLSLTVIDMKYGQLSATSQDIIGEFEKVMGAGSGTAANMSQVARSLAQNATALADDGSQGYVANVMTTAQMDTAYAGSAPHATAAAGVFGQTMNLNRDHFTFNGGASVDYVLAHEPNHHFGRPDLTCCGSNPAVAYKRGVLAERNAFRSLSPGRRLVNPDHLAELTHP